MRFTPLKSAFITLVVAVAFSSSPATSSAAVATTQQAAFIADCSKAVEPWKNLSAVSPRKVAEVVRFSEAAGLLVAEWPILRDTSVSSRVPLTDLPGSAKIECMGAGRPHHPIYPIFEYYDFKRPDFSCEHLQVLAMPTNLQVVQDWEWPGGEIRTVSLVENFMTPTDSPVTLRAQCHAGERDVLNVVLSANSLDDIRRDHPNEFEEYLRPLLQAFNQESAVFWIDDRIGWQVLADSWSPSAELRERVMGVVAKLDAPDFAGREQAQKDLRSLGEPAALLLHSLDRRGWTAEQIARTDKFMAGYFTLSPEKAEQLGQSLPFLINCLTSQDRALRAAALGRLERVTGHRIDYNVDATSAQRNLMLDQIRGALTGPNPADPAVSNGK